MRWCGCGFSPRCSAVRPRHPRGCPAEAAGRAGAGISLRPLEPGAARLADGPSGGPAGSTGGGPAATAAGIEEAVADGRILRTHILRPTWHFVHRDDLRWLLALSAPRLHQGNAGMYRRTGIDAAAAARSGEVLAGAVAGGNHLTREQLAATLQDAGFAGKGLELAYLIMHAEISGVLVSGSPVRSRGGALKQTYALFDERVPAGPGRAADPGGGPGGTCPALFHEPRSRHRQGLCRLVGTDDGRGPGGPAPGHGGRSGSPRHCGD